MLFLDDILRKNLYLSKYAARSADQLNQQLGKYTSSSPAYIVFLFYYFFSSLAYIVQEVTYERVLPTHNAADLRTSTEFNFVIPPRTDYFTRYIFFYITSPRLHLE